MVLVASLAFAGPSPETVAALTGAWRLADGRDAAQAHVDASIEAAIAPFNVLIRGLARGPLHDVAYFCERHATVLTETSFFVGCDTRADVTGVFARTGIPGVSAEGKRWLLDTTWDAGSVTLVFRNDDGWQRVRYIADAGGMSVDKTVHANRLDADVHWTLEYTRR